LRVAIDPAITRDGRQVEVCANIGQVSEAEATLRYGAEGAGLLRTEFLYLDRASAPDEEEQVQAYTAIAQVFDQRPLVIRTLDIGGDKVLPYMSMQAEDNPFLGLRGIRLCLSESELFSVQLRAILRASYGHNIKIMFPMVATVEEVRQAKALLSEARTCLASRGIQFGNPEVGIMIEIPAAALMADILAKELNFFSIGTNDLTQYVLAADRTNARVQPLTDALHPAVLRIIAATISSAHQAGIWVGLCGELAGDPLAVPVLLGLGLDEFSMARPAIPQVKQLIRSWSRAHAEQISQAVLEQENAEAVRALLENAVPA
jgi:phosphoenolpyruvate-protein phosphotransferase